MHWLFALLACTGSAPTDSESQATDDATASATESSSDTEPQGELSGTVPAKSFACPTFTATNYDETERDRDDLIGHPTVMWFYPLAASAG